MIVLYGNNWIHGTNQPLSRSLLLHELFEIFLTNPEMERICVESNNTPIWKVITCLRWEKLKNFQPILLVSEYAGLPRQKMYLERREDCHNLVVSAMMTKTKFLESNDIYIRLIITLSIVQINLRPLFNVIKKKCTLNDQSTQHW